MYRQIFFINLEKFLPFPPMFSSDTPLRHPGPGSVCRPLLCLQVSVLPSGFGLSFPCSVFTPTGLFLSSSVFNLLLIPSSELFQEGVPGSDLNHSGLCVENQLQGNSVSLRIVFVSVQPEESISWSCCTHNDMTSLTCCNQVPQSLIHEVPWSGS